MDSFRTVTNRLINYAFKLNANETPSPNQAIDSTKLTEEYKQRIINEWMHEKIQQFTTEVFYKGIQSMQGNEKAEQEAVYKIRKIWQLFYQQHPQPTEIELPTQISKPQPNKATISQPRKILTEFHNLLKQCYFATSDTPQISGLLGESFIARFYDTSVINQNQAYENNSQTYIMDWTQVDRNKKVNIQQRYPAITLVNPLFTVYRTVTDSHKNYEKITIKLSIKMEAKLFLTRPTCIILTSSSLRTLLSTISLTHLTYYSDQTKDLIKQPSLIINETIADQERQRAAYVRMGTRNIIKIITTKQIYHQYLRLFTYIRLIASFIDSQKESVNSISSIQTADSQNLKQQLSERYKAYQEEKSKIIQNKVHYILSKFHFYVISPQQKFCYNNLLLCFRNNNLFPYQTYDLEVYEQKSEKFLGLVQENALKDVKSIYYTHKKGFISQDSYLNIIKRLQEKQTLLKTNLGNKNQPYIFPPQYSASLIQSPTSCHPLVYMYRKIELSALQDRNSITRTSLLQKDDKTTKIIGMHTREVVRYNNNLFAKLRRIEAFSPLSDADIFRMTQTGGFHQLKKSQTFFNPSISLEEVIIVLHGLCQIQHQSLPSSCYIEQGNMFGWKYFMKSITAKKQDYTLLKAHHIQDEICQSKVDLLAGSTKCQLFVLRFKSLQFFLHDKLPFLIDIHHSNLFAEKTSKSGSKQEIRQIIFETLKIKEPQPNKLPILSQSRQLAKILLEPKMLKRFQLFRQTCSKPKPLQTDYLAHTQHSPLKVLLLNYPNLLLTF